MQMQMQFPKLQHMMV